MKNDGAGQGPLERQVRQRQDTIDILRARCDMLSYELQRLRDALWQTYMLSPEGREELLRIQKALDFDA